MGILPWVQQISLKSMSFLKRIETFLKPRFAVQLGWKKEAGNARERKTRTA